MDVDKIFTSDINIIGRIGIIILGAMFLYFTSHGIFYPLWMDTSTPLFWQLIAGAISLFFVGTAAFLVWAIISALCGVLAWGITGDFSDCFGNVFCFPVFLGIFLLKFFFGNWDRLWWRKK